MVDEVDVAIVDEFQPQWLAFLNREIDGLAGVTGSLPSQFASIAMPGNKLAPNLAKQGIQLVRNLAPDMTKTVFNMEDPTIGGMQPAQVALRRAIGLAYNVEEEIRNIRRSQAVIAQSIVMPHSLGYDPDFKSEMGDYSPARANALLDTYGFADRDGDGWREKPDGSPLLLVVNTEPEQIYRAHNELIQKCAKAIGIRVDFKTQQWPENLKAVEAGKFMIWKLGWQAAYRRAERAGDVLRPANRQPEPVALQARRVRPAVRAHALDARRPRARRRCSARPSASAWPTCR